MYERCPPAVVNKIVGEVFDSALKSRGFQKASPRKYVRPRIAHTHDVVELHSDVTRLLLIWGLSLNFVPHISGRSTETVQWHRTPRSAIPDLRYSEIEDMRHFHPQYAISTINGPRITREQALVAHSVLLPRAFQFFDSVMNLSSIGELFVRQEQNPKWGNIFTTPQVALAYAFYLAKTGREAKARAYMSEWLRRSSHRREETNTRLSLLFEEAVRLPLIYAVTPALGG